MKYLKPIFDVTILDEYDVITQSDFYIEDPDWFD